jgi:hypothetical protein
MNVPFQKHGVFHSNNVLVIKKRIRSFFDLKKQNHLNFFIFYLFSKAC